MNETTPHALHAARYKAAAWTVTALWTKGGNYGFSGNDAHGNEYRLCYKAGVTTLRKYVLRDMRTGWEWVDCPEPVVRSDEAKALQAEYDRIMKGQDRTTADERRYAAECLKRANEV